VIRKSLEDPHVRDWLGDDFATALYPSAGLDTRPLTFLHPSVLAARAPDAGCPAPRFFVYGDRSRAFRNGFHDGRTRITIIWRRPLDADAKLYGLEWQSDCFESRRYVIAYFRSENGDLAALAHREGWTPDVFIGVCDGCAFGGNPPHLCVNRLTRHGRSVQDARTVALPRWWVTDHFSDASVPDPFTLGSVVTSTDSQFPVRFRGHGCLSREWGGYRNWSALRGTWLFEVA
jgi:hypothetical protein